MRSIKFHHGFGKNFMLNSNFIIGVAKMKGGVKILRDIDRVLSGKKKTL